MSLDGYSMLACAAAGRPLVVVETDGSTVFTDGDQVYLPKDRTDSRVAVAVQGTLVSSGSLDPEVLRQLQGRRRVAARYVTLEVARGCRLHEASLPRWVTQEVAAHWNGTPTGSPADSLRRALRDPTVPEAPAAFGTIRSRKVRSTGATFAGEIDADRVQELLEDLLDEAEDDEELDDLGTHGNRSAGIGGKVLARLLGDLVGAKRQASPEGGAGTGAETVGGVARSPRVQSLVSRVLPGAVDPGAREVPAPQRGVAYPEWDHRRSEYRPDWCRVVEFSPPSTASEPVPRWTDAALRRRIARVGLVYRRHRRQTEGDSLDIGGLVDFAVDRRLGDVSDGRVYEATLRTGRDLGVLVLLDSSGSTGDGASAKKIWDGHREVANRLAAALEDVGDRVAVHAFHSQGRSIRFFHVKGFDDRFDLAARARLGSIEPSGYTRLGAAVRHATHLLQAGAGAHQQLLLLVSDGLPYDDGYEAEHAEQDTRRALDEAHRAGAGVACVSIATSTSGAALERLWGNVPHLALTSPDELVEHIEPLLRSALEAQKSIRRSDLDHKGARPT